MSIMNDFKQKKKKKKILENFLHLKKEGNRVGFFTEIYSILILKNN